MPRPDCRQCGGSGTVFLTMGAAVDGFVSKRQAPCPACAASEQAATEAARPAYETREGIALDKRLTAIEARLDALAPRPTPPPSACDACAGAKVVTLGGAEYPCPKCERASYG